MKKQIVSITLLLLFAACEEIADTSVHGVNQNEMENVKEFVLPDSIHVERELVIAAYYEIHPVNACVVFAYTDTTRTSANKYSYTTNSDFTVSELEVVGHNEFRIKNAPGESYIIKPGSVVWVHQSGTVSSTAEYERVDILKE
jgi:hypothetical protein